MESWPWTHHVHSQSPELLAFPGKGQSLSLSFLETTQRNLSPSVQSKCLSRKGFECNNLTFSDDSLLPTEKKDYN